MRVRILHFSPGTATARQDSLRAGLGFVAFLQEAFQQSGVGGTVEWCWALPALTDGAEVHRMLSGADLLVVVTPTYAQGSPWFVRRFFELGVGLQLWGTLGTALATAGVSIPGARWRWRTPCGPCRGWVAAPSASPRSRWS